MKIAELESKIAGYIPRSKRGQALDNTKKSRCKACDAQYHAHAIENALEVFYWTGSPFHYHVAISQFEKLICEMAKLQNLFRKEVKE